MPIKRTLTRTEAARHRANGNRSVNAFTEVTVLTEEERAALNTALDSNRTTDEFLENFADASDEDRATLASEYKLARDLRVSKARGAERRAAEADRPVRQKQPVSPKNPFGAYLDPRHDELPEYPAVGHAQRTKLADAAKDYREAADLLDTALVGMADEFAEAFAKEDERRAARERIKNTANPKTLQDHRNRMNRIG